MNHKNKMFEMKKPKKSEEKESSERLLRNTVEEKLVSFSGASSKMKKRAPEDVIHELQVHQIELKMQNEELRKSQLALEESRQRFADLYDFSPMGYFTLTPAALIKEVNLTGAILLGEDRRKLINSRFRRMVTTQDQDLWDNHFLSVLKQGKKQTCDLMLKRQDGSFFQAGLESIRMEVSGEATVIHTAVTDITERKQAEERERLAREVLDLLNRKEEVADSISDILLMVKSHTNFEAVGIRLSEGDDFPYYQTNGFSEDFLIAERSLCLYDEEGNIVSDEVGNPVLECMCGNILRGRTNDKLPFFTKGGSFWTNSTTKLLASTTEKDRQSPTRNRCNREGYESVALIPLRFGDKIIGLLQLNDRRVDRFNAEMIRFFEGLGASIGIALSRKRGQEELQENLHKNSTQNEIARIFLNVPDEKMYAEVLKVILREMESKYGVFGYLDEHGTFIAPSMTRGIWDKCQLPDKTIVFPRETWGDSIWGRAILEKRSLWKNEPRKVPQGHIPIENILCVPILFREEAIAEFQVANRQGGYGEANKEWLEGIAEFIAPVLRARLERDLNETQRKQTEETLRLSEEKISKAFQASPDWMTISTFEEGRYIDVNDAFVESSGFIREEALGKTLIDLGILVDPHDRDRAVEIIRKEGCLKNFESKIRIKSGKVRIMLWSAETFDFKGQKYVTSTKRDITELRKAQENLEQALENIRRALGGTIEAVAMTSEVRDPYTAGHQKRVANLSRVIAQEMGLLEDQVNGLQMAGAIHDLGKISVPAEILSKPTKLSNIEFSLIKNHSQIGYDILKDIDFPWPIARIVLEHHERMNGSGYPNGLTGDQLRPETKILMVADVVEAMASYRPYRPALGIEAALEEIEKNKGILYDFRVVETCSGLFREKGFSFG